MHLVRLVYTSTISDGFTEADIQNILTSARDNNAPRHITGLLFFNRSYFLQCLEGPREQVNQTYHQILNDQRHENLMLLEYKEISSREFSEWSMGYVPDIAFTKNLNLKYSGNTHFNPYHMSGESAHNLLSHLSKEIGII